MIFKALLGITYLVMSAAKIASKVAPTPFSQSVSRRRNHNLPPINTIKVVIPKTKRTRDVKQKAVDAWLGSTNCGIVAASSQDVIDLVTEFALLSKRDMTELEWAPAGMSRALHSARKQLGASLKGRIVELPQGRLPSLWTINPEFTPEKPTKKAKKTEVDTRLLSRLYADREKWKVCSLILIDAFKFDSHFVHTVFSLRSFDYFLTSHKGPARPKTTTRWPSRWQKRAHV